MSKRSLWLYVCMSALCTLPLLCFAQTTSSELAAGSTQSQAPATSGIPRLLKFQGKLPEIVANQVPGVAVQFAFYAEQNGGTPLWSETQDVVTDSTGAFTVILGAATTGGLPLSLFQNASALWIGVEEVDSGRPELPRVQLVSVPYALKASDAETLGGHPASDFLLATAPATNNVKNGATVALTTNSNSFNVATASATANTIPKFLDSATLTNSSVTEVGGNVGIGNSTPGATLDVAGTVNASSTGSFNGLINYSNTLLAAAGISTAGQGYASGALDFDTSSFNSGTNTAQDAIFRWQALPVGNNTSSPSGRLALLTGAPGSTAETGLSIDNSGVITFAAGQTFPGGVTLNSSNSFVAPITVGQVGAQTVPLTVMGTNGQTSNLFDVQDSSGNTLFNIGANGQLRGGTLGGSWTMMPSADSNGNLVLSPFGASNSVFAIPGASGQAAALFVSKAGLGQTGSLFEAQNYSDQPLFAIAPSGELTLKNWSDQTVGFNLNSGNNASQAKDLRAWDRATLQYTLRFTADGAADFLGGPTQTRRFRVAGDSDTVFFGSAMDTNLYRAGASALETDGGFIINYSGAPTYPFEVRNGGQSVFRILSNGTFEGGPAGGSLMFRPSALSNGNLVLSPSASANSVFVMPSVSNQAAASFVSRAGSGQAGSLFEAQNYFSQPVLAVSPTGDSTWNNWIDRTFAINLVAGNAASQNKEIRGFDRSVLQQTIRFSADGNLDFLSGPSQQRRLRIDGNSDTLWLGSALDTNLYRSAPGVLKTDANLVVAPAATPFSPNGNTKLYVEGQYGAEAVNVNVPAGSPVDIQTWRVGGQVVTDVTSTGAIELVQTTPDAEYGIVFLQSSGTLNGGGGGSIGEPKNGSMTFLSGPASNGNQVFNALASGAHYFQYGGVTSQFFDHTGLTFVNSKAISFQNASGSALPVVLGNSDNSLSIGSLGAGIRFTSAGGVNSLASFSETGDFQLAGNAAVNGGITAASFTGDGSGLTKVVAANAISLNGQPAAAFEQVANKNVASGYAGLDSLGLLARAEIPVGAVFADQSNTFVAGTQDFSGATATLPVKAVSVANLPTACQANKELVIATDAAAGQQLMICNSSGTGFSPVGASSNGTTAAGQLIVQKGVAADGGGLKHIRVPVPPIDPGASADVTLSWTTPFADNQYTATCSVVDTTDSGAALRVHHVVSVTAAGVTVRVSNDDTVTAHIGSLNCIAMHD